MLQSYHTLKDKIIPQISLELFSVSIEFVASRYYTLQWTTVYQHFNNKLYTDMSYSYVRRLGMYVCTVVFQVNLRSQMFTFYVNKT